MVNEEKATILIVEDDLDVADMLNAYFRVQGYQVLTANWGEDGLRAAQSSHPDIIILDIRLPDIDGFEVAQRLGANQRTSAIPIIFLTEKRERVDRLKGLELRAVDYITKPFDIQELRLKVRNTLLRIRQGTLTHPVTGLPEGQLIDERLTRCLQEPEWAILVVSLVNLQPFREAYGFVAADDLLRAAAIMLEDTLRSGGLSAFLGQLQPDQFIIVTLPRHVEYLVEHAAKRLEQSFDYFYRDQDRTTEFYTRQRLSIKMSPLLSSQSTAVSLDQLKQQLTRLNH